MKKIIIIFLFLITLLIPTTVLAQEIDQVNNFHSEITINQDTSITIKETIDYETNLVKHGIYRYIPYRYNQNNLSYTANIKNIKITDDNQDRINYTLTKDSKFVTLRIGDADVTFTGPKTYVITYTVENALKRFEGYDELYWDITGEGWQIPVLNSQAIINSPYANIQDATCFSGRGGTNDELCTHSFESSTAIFAYDQEIVYGKNFTTLVALDPNGGIIFPTQFDLFVKKLKDNWFAGIAILPAFIFFLIWNSKGRDWMFVSPNIYKMDKNAPKQKKPFFYKHRSAFHYEPLKKLTPGEVGLLIDEKVDNQDVIAEIIDLARQKYIKIETIEKKGIFGKKDYQFTKLKDSDSKLSVQQKYLLDSLFASGVTSIGTMVAKAIKMSNNKTLKDNTKEALEKLSKASTKKTVKLSDLKGTFYTHMEKTKDLINANLKTKEIFSNNPKNARVGNIVLAIFLNGFIMFLAIGFSSVFLTALPIVISVVSGIICLLFAWNMPAKTAIGTNYYLQSSGLRTMIKAGKWRHDIAEKKLFIEEVLPFAISLGVVKQLAKEMDKLNIKAPNYLDANMANLSNFSTASFINSFSSAASSNLSYNPSSSSYSGGSGFSGGGSSGGGGGGGGGGSW